MKEKSILAQNIRTLRKKRGWTQVQASRCCADCDRQCANACQNHPSRCGLEDKARRRRGRKC